MKDESEITYDFWWNHEKQTHYGCAKKMINGHLYGFVSVAKCIVEFREEAQKAFARVEKDPPHTLRT